MYLADVYHYFIEKRGGPVFLSPLDVHRILKWEEEGIPKAVLFRVIGEVLDNRRGPDGRLVEDIRSLAYFTPFLDNAWQSFRRKKIGAHAPESMPAEPLGIRIAETIPAMWSEIQKNIGQNGIMEREWGQQFAAWLETELSKIAESARNRELDEYDHARRTFDTLDRDVSDKLLDYVDQDILMEIQTEAIERLQTYTRQISGDQLQRVLNSMVRNLLRERYQIPRFFLFDVI